MPRTAKKSIETAEKKNTKTIKPIKQVEPVQELPEFKKGSFYKLLTPLFIRKEPCGANKKMYELPVYLKMVCRQNPYGDAVLPEGLKVECLDTVKDGRCIWMLIPGGCLCVVGLTGNSFVEEV